MAGFCRVEAWDAQKCRYVMWKLSKNVYFKRFCNKQVLSPITGRVIGAKEVRVGNDKVGLTKLLVQVVSGLQLNISPDTTTENGYIAETTVTRKLTAQYQVKQPSLTNSSAILNNIFIFAGRSIRHRTRILRWKQNAPSWSIRQRLSPSCRKQRPRSRCFCSNGCFTPPQSNSCWRR